MMPLSLLAAQELVQLRCTTISPSLATQELWCTITRPAAAATFWDFHSAHAPRHRPTKVAPYRYLRTWSMQLRATHTFIAGRAANKQMQQSNKETMQVPRKCANMYISWEALGRYTGTVALQELHWTMCCNNCTATIVRQQLHNVLHICECSAVHICGKSEASRGSPASYFVSLPVFCH